MTRFGLPLLLALSIGCSSGQEGPTDSGVQLDCPTFDDATFELGTGQLEFIPIEDEQPLTISQGAQGGCHFFISARTSGFADRRFRIQYEVFFAESSTTTDSRSSFTVRLLPDESMPGKCLSLGTTGFLIQPWRFREERVILEVNVTDDEGRTATQRRTVIAHWPDDLPDDGCGARS